jgi:hypothetical protein
MVTRSNPADNHATPALLASSSSRGPIYDAIVWNADGIADVLDSHGVLVPVQARIGGVYPVRNYGVVTGGTTDISQGDFICLSHDQ